MDAQTKKIIQWAIDNADLALYAPVKDFDPGEDWDGAAPGNVAGSAIHLISQSETECVYGETTDDIAAARYLVGDCVIIEDGSARQAVEALLDELFGDQSTWPDSYAQTHGWVLPV